MDMEKKLWKLLAAFFIVMAFFTVVSRAAASVMVAKVQVAVSKSGELSYKLTGTGTVKENAEKYIDLQQGYKIGEVAIKTGQQVEKGDLLFVYDQGQLMEKKDSLNKELKKLKLQYEKSSLSGQNPDGSQEVNAANLAVQTAEDALKAAREELDEHKKNARKEKEEAYKEAASVYEEMQDSREAEENKAKRAVLDAERELGEAKRPLTELTEKTDLYKESVYTGKEENITNASRSIFDFYYEGAYKEHLEEKSEAEDDAKRAAEDLEDINKKWDKAIDEWDKYASDEAEQRAYYAQVAARQEEIKNATRVLSDAQKKLQQLSEPDGRLSLALDNYRRALEENNRDLESAYYPLYQILYDNLKLDDKKIDEAALKLERAREDADQVNRQWQKKAEAAKVKKDDLSDLLKKIKEGDYDYKEELKKPLKAVEQAEQALKAAQLSLSGAKSGEALTRINNQVQDKIQVLDRDMLQLDLDSKQEEISKLDGIIKNKGKVTAPLAGTVTKNDLEQGNVLSGQEKLIIATGGYELFMTAGKEELKQFAAGDELQVNISPDHEKITSVIENIELPDAEGKVKFTALLPEGAYKEGNSLDYEITKESETYHSCIPVQAIREDSGGTFVLLVKEKDSVLGKEETAFRLNVTIISQDEKTAAVQASLSEEDQIITGSNKNIAEGDRVRRYEMD